MKVTDIIEKTFNKIELTEEEISFLIQEYTNNQIPDYQMSSWLMCVRFNGLSEKETYFLTKAMIESGDVIDLSFIDGIKVDKHSTGGVGDKTSLVLGPLAASCGNIMAKLSGRGLGHTGGTIDKLESIPGLNTNLSDEKFTDQINKIHIAIAGQTKNLVPADKKLYALRDVTQTVNSLPLITSSIMSKKIASGADVICLDVKYGSGAFMKTTEDAIKLSEAMINIAHKFDKKVICFITDMEHPLGKGIGNRIEVIDAVNCLQNKGPKDLEDLCVTICGYMNYYSNITKSVEDGMKLALEKLRDFSAYNKFIEMIQMQGAKVTNFDNFIEAKKVIPLLSKSEGYISRIDALSLGLIALELGAGRETKEDIIDPNVGLYLNKQIGEYVTRGDILLYIYANDKWSDDIIDRLYLAYKFSSEAKEEKPIIYKIIE